jgi:hypothetical protein
MIADVDLGGAHPSLQDLAAYLDRTPPGPGRDRVEAHLVLCDRCLNDLIAVGRVLRWYEAGGR